MNVFIACFSCLIVGFIIGFTIAWRMQKKRLEAGFNNWAQVKTLNEYGNRITADVRGIRLINGTNKIQIHAVYEDPFSDISYSFRKTFLVRDTSPAIMQRLQRIQTVRVLVHRDTTPTNGLYWMERPW